MSDKLQWFKFHPSDWMMGRIRKLDKETQADFISLVCIYWNNECTLSVEDAELEIGEDALTKLVKYKIVKKDSDSIGIHFLDEQWNEIDEKTDHQSRSGQLGNLKRWHPMLYSRVMKGELSIEDAYAMDKESAPDHPPIETQSRNIADKKREDKSREEQNRKDSDFSVEIWPTFDDFWDSYGKKHDRKKCVRAWDKLKHEEKETIMSHLKFYIPQNPNTQYRKNPLTYLNGEVWKDEDIPSQLNGDGHGKTANTPESRARYFAEKYSTDNPG